MKYIDADGIYIESAIVKYSDLSRTELTKHMLSGKIVSRYITPDDCCQLGCLKV